MPRIFNVPVGQVLPSAILLTLLTAPFAGGILRGQQPDAIHAHPQQPERSTSMVAADFDEDGYPDLIIGSALSKGGSITLKRGNPDAIAPRTEASWRAAGRHELTQPFLDSGETVRLPNTPDMLAAADVDGDGHLDLAYASKNGNVLRVMAGSGKGTFATDALALTLPGNVTALAAYRPGAPTLGEVLLAGYETRQGAYVAIVSDRKAMLKIEATYRLPGAATAFSVSNLSEDHVPDTAIVAGGQLLVLHGRNAISGGGRLETLPVDNVEAVATGEFLFDRHRLMQIAALTSDGDVLILAHQGIDSRPFTPQEVASARHLRPGSPTLAQLAGNIANEPWMVVEANSQVAPHSAGSVAPVLLRTRISGSGGDDLVVLNASQQQRLTISHPASKARASTAASARTGSASLTTADEVVGAAAIRISADGRPGLVMLTRNSAQPEFTVPSAGNTYYVNTTVDNIASTTDLDDGTRCSSGSSEICTLRDAVTFVNADSSDNISSSESDTIMVPAGTYPLSWQAGAVDGNGNALTHLEVLGPVTFVGSTSGSGVVINGQNHDVVFTINPGLFGSFNPNGYSYQFDTTLENITIENGTNSNNLNQYPNANSVGGGMNWDAFGAGNLQLTNVTFKNNTVEYGPGGGLWVENSVGSGSGTATLTAGTLIGNATAEEGGGIYVAYPYATVAATNTIVTGNTANPTANPSDPGGFGAGGGIYFDSRTSPSASPQSTFTGVQITSNNAAQQGGGIYSNSGILVKNSTIASNSAAQGGGIYADEDSDETGMTVTNANILANTASTDGGAMFVGNDNPSAGIPSLTVSLSRIFQNTSNSTSGLAIQGSGAAAATDNWWGCNTGPAASPCDLADTPAVTSPWAVLSLTENPSTILLGGHIVLAVSLNSDSNGQPISGAFPAVGGDSFNLAVTGVSTSPALTSGSFNSAGTSAVTMTPSDAGSGTVSASFDNQTVSVNFTVQIAVPNVIGETQSAATTAITNAGLKVGTVTSMASSTVPAGEIISESPAAGTAVNVGSSVNLVFSIGLSRSTMSSPTPSSTLAGPSVTFSWTTVSGSTGYAIWIGTTGVGSENLYSTGVHTTTSAAVAGLPTTGATIYVRLWTSFNGTLVSNDYTYTAAAQATLTSPSPSTTLAGPNVTFSWSTATGSPTGYAIWIGNSGVGSNNLYATGVHTTTSAAVTGLPTTGAIIYVRLWTSFNGALVSSDYSYTASTRAAITSPSPTRTFAGPGATFTWSAATGSPTGYAIWIGSTGKGSEDISSSGVHATTSAVVKGLPTNGKTIYVRLWTSYNGTLVSTDYTYTAANQAAMTSPVPGSTLAGANVTFSWSTATGSPSGYAIWIGSSGVGSNNVYSTGIHTTTSASATGLPTNGGRLYVRLWTSFNGTLVSTDYVYNAYAD